MSLNRSHFFGLQFKVEPLVQRYKDLLSEIFNLSYMGRLGGLNDILSLSVNDRIILLDILSKTKKMEKNNEEANRTQM